MKIPTAVVALFCPGKALHAQALKQMAGVPGSEMKPLATLLQKVHNAGVDFGQTVRSSAHNALTAHFDRKSPLSGAAVLAQVKNLRNTLERREASLMKNSAGVRAGSDYAQQLSSTAKAIASCRSFAADVAGKRAGN